MNANREVAIDVTSRHGHVSERMEEYATKKSERLQRFHDRLTRIEVIVDGPHEAPDVEMIAHIDGHGTLVAREHDEHFSHAIDRLAAKMERQLVKAKEKQMQRNHNVESIRGMDEPDRDSVEPEDSFEDAVRKKLDS